ncbi:unnamed protein product [Rhodiola kirilowii]
MSAEAGSFVIWLHGLGDSGPANEPIQNLFTASEFRDTRWSFPTAHSNPVTCNNGRVMPSWFDIHKFPVTGEKWQPNRSARFTWFRKIVNFRMTAKSESSPEVTTGLLDSVKRVHALIGTQRWPAELILRRILFAGPQPRKVQLTGPVFFSTRKLWAGCSFQRMDSI